APVVLMVGGLIYNAYLQVERTKVAKLQSEVAAAETKAKKEADAATTANKEAQAKQAAADAANKEAEQLKKKAAEYLEQAEGLRLAAESRVVLPDHPALGLLLAIEGAQRGQRRSQHNAALLAAMDACLEERTLLGHTAKVRDAVFSPDGT